MLGPSQKTLRPPVSQAGYGPGYMNVLFVDKFWEYCRCESEIRHGCLATF